MATFTGSDGAPVVVVAFEVVGAVESVELEQEPATAETKIAQAPIHKTRPVEVIPGCIGGLYRDPKKGGRSGNADNALLRRPEGWQPRADSNRRYRLERAVSWAARRRGQTSFARETVKIVDALCGDAVRSGSGGRTRTSNLLIQSQAFRQLNYPRSAR